MSVDIDPAVATLPAPLQIGVSDGFTAAFYAKIMSYLVNRITAIESFKPSWENEVDRLVASGLQRFNEQILPVYEKLQDLLEIGAQFMASSSTYNTVAPTETFFIIDPLDAPAYAPTGYVLVVSKADTRNSLTGRFLSYDRPSGKLTLDILQTTGSGVHNDWQLLPTLPPFVPLAILDGGSDGNNALSSVPFVFSDPLTNSQVVTSLQTAFAGSIRSKWLAAFGQVVNGGVTDIATNIPDQPDGPIWLSFNDAFVTKTSPLVAYVKARYNLTDAQINGIFTAAGPIITS